MDFNNYHLMVFIHIISYHIISYHFIWYLSFSFISSCYLHYCHRCCRLSQNIIIGWFSLVRCDVMWSYGISYNIILYDKLYYKITLYDVMWCDMRIFAIILTFISVCSSSLRLPSRPIRGPKAPITRTVLSASVYMTTNIIWALDYVIILWNICKF